jgi:hypothetical protein
MCPIYRTEDELLTHLETMSEVEHLRALRCAAILIPGTPWGKPKDLFDDAVESTYRGTLGAAGGRRWLRAQPLIVHIIMTERGLVSDWRRDAFNIRAVPLDSADDVCLMQTSNPPHNQMGWALSTPSVEQQVIWAEEQALAEQLSTVARTAVLEHFRNDPVVCFIIGERLKGTPRRRILERSGLLELELASAERRLRRGLVALRTAWGVSRSMNPCHSSR